jgi:hypothetical protein
VGQPFSKKLSPYLRIESNSDSLSELVSTFHVENHDLLPKLIGFNKIDRHSIEITHQHHIRFYERDQVRVFGIN